jgi:hypothetical protein
MKTTVNEVELRGEQTAQIANAIAENKDRLYFPSLDG